MYWLAITLLAVLETLGAAQPSVTQGNNFKSTKNIVFVCPSSQREVRLVSGTLRFSNIITVTAPRFGLCFYA